MFNRLKNWENLDKKKLNKKELEYYTEESYKGELIKTEKQRRRLRIFVSILAFSTIGLLAKFEWMLFYIIKQHIITSEGFNIFFLMYAITPIVSITLILILLITGVFRGFKESDMESILAKIPVRRVNTDP
ncbi:MAG: hypothetical protein OXD45_15300 [Rhodobacteraceae bacterium]|nr:hypothetical protein [Paracoccaceae bacterium]